MLSFGKSVGGASRSDRVIDYLKMSCRRYGFLGNYYVVAERTKCSLGQSRFYAGGGDAGICNDDMFNHREYLNKLVTAEACSHLFSFLRAGGRLDGCPIFICVIMYGF